ncbi:MAG: mechanosensitive ion channel [Bradymonadales bacterium]|nr:mechanosensitive ion channel [Bradymonadales bacterium]
MGVTDHVLESIARTTPRVLLALLILVVGWIGARVLSKALFILLARTSLEEWSTRRLGVRTGGKYGHRVERIVARFVFYTLLLILVVVVLSVLDLESINRPLINLVDQVLLALPKVLLAVLIVLVAFILGKVASFGLTKGLQAIRFDERFGRFGGMADSEKLNLSRNVGDLVFWFILVIGVIQGLSALDMQIFVEPLQEALNRLGQLLPNLVGGALILLLGILLARMAGRLVTNLLASVGFDGLVSRIGLVPSLPSLSKSPADTTAPPADTNPQTDEPSGVNPSKQGSAKPPRATEPPASAQQESTSATPEEKHRTTLGFLPASPSKIVGLAVAIVIFLLVLTQVLSILHLDHLASFLPIFILVLAKIGLALVILGAGVWAGNWLKARIDAHQAARVGLQRYLGTGARVTLILFASAMGLQQLGVAPALIVTAFAILFGALCLALALAFGLGGRQVAGELLQREVERNHPGTTGRTGRAGKKKETP